MDQQPGLVCWTAQIVENQPAGRLEASRLPLEGGFWACSMSPQAVRVGVMSPARAGLATLQETRGEESPELRGHVIWQGIDNLHLVARSCRSSGNLNYMDALGEFIKSRRAAESSSNRSRRTFATPLAADKGNNLFAMGELLRSVNDVCQECGCTLLIAHHMKKSTGVATTTPPNWQTRRGLGGRSGVAAVAAC